MYFCPITPFTNISNQLYSHGVLMTSPELHIISYHNTRLPIYMSPFLLYISIIWISIRDGGAALMLIFLFGKYIRRTSVRGPRDIVSL